ncbi:hypothetical protein F511_15420 [Dorcoceras hygrometricum]|uniref:Uncharacterized protein n=1 Tax=Dorcoceras hygrometricum TaxID=472368 RepID=A0A2Z7A5G9_9LAMI|nr:hypothetical protein F511_15420 [Dorcoceras hygrometricum]
MNFFKASVIHDAYESVKYDDQTTGKLNHKGKNGIGYIKPENCKPSWLKNRLEKDKEKAVPKSSVPNQQRRGSTKTKSVWVKVQPTHDLNDQSTKQNLNRSHNISARTLVDVHTGKTVKITPIRSTIGDGFTSSACTRSLDEICADGFSSSRLAGNNFPAARGGGGGGAQRRRRRGLRRGAAATNH